MLLSSITPSEGSRSTWRTVKRTRVDADRWWAQKALLRDIKHYFDLETHRHRASRHAAADELCDRCSEENPVKLGIEEDISHP